jgi:hypothetical protein
LDRRGYLWSQSSTGQGIEPSSALLNGVSLPDISIGGGSEWHSKVCLTTDLTSAPQMVHLAIEN